MPATASRSLFALRPVVVLVLLATLGLTGCSGSAAKSGASNRPTIVFVPKLVGIGFYDAMKRGADQYAKQAGINFQMIGPTTADSAKQIEIVSAAIERHPTAIVVAPDDPVAIVPVLAKAREAGIKVYSTDTDAAQNRLLWVNQADGNDIGRAITDALASQMGGQGEWAIVSCGPTAQNLNSWIAVEKAYAQERYPQMKLDAVVYSGEDQAQGVKLAKDLMSAHPGLRGLVGECTTSAPAVGQAITETRRIGTVFSTGLGLPSVMRQYVQNGATAKFVLWDVVNLGYLTAWAGKQLIDGVQFHPGTYHVGGPVGDVTYYAERQELRLGLPVTFDKNSIGRYATEF